MRLPKCYMRAFSGSVFAEGVSKNIYSFKFFSPSKKITRNRDLSSFASISGDSKDGLNFYCDSNKKPSAGLLKAVEIIESSGQEAFHNKLSADFSQAEYTEAVIELKNYTPEPKETQKEWTCADQIALLDSFCQYNGSLLKIQLHTFPTQSIQVIINRLQEQGDTIRSFSGDERFSLRAAVRDLGFNWSEVALRVATKSPQQCQAHYLLYDSVYNITPRKSIVFTSEHHAKLMEYAKKYGTTDWKRIAALFNNTFKHKFLKSRYLLGLSNSCPHWTEAEDNIILEHMSRPFPSSYAQISSAFNHSRSTRDIRARWEKINPSRINGPWSDSDNTLLNALVKEHGAHWTTIERVIKSRSAAECQSQWYKINYPTLGSPVTTRKR